MLRLTYQPISRVLFISSLILFLFVYVQSLEAAQKPITDCTDVAIIFARGSGQNPDHEYIDDPSNEDFAKVEKESYRFFLETKYHLDNRFPLLDYKAVTIHDFPGKYDPVGYKAVAVGYDDPQKLLNSSNADVSWIPGQYQESVEHGIAETVGYIKDQIQSCPNQHLIVGGYSQGAQVMGDSLFQLTAAERDKILAVGLFGDPKYTGFYQGVSQPWRRGEATNRDTGMLDARVPYVPQGLEKRTISWCSAWDMVCAGWSAASKHSSHSTYSGNPILFASDELINMAAPILNAKQRSKGGLSSETGTIELSQENRDKMRDVMFVINDNSNSDTIQTFRYGLDPMLYHFSNNFALTRYAAKAIGENDYGFSAPRVNNIQSFLPYLGYDPSRPSTTASNITYAFANRYPFGQPIYGGGDNPDPYQIGLERAIVSSGWEADPSVERNIIFIVDRPPKDPYEYNICNGVVRQWLQFPDVDGYRNCYTNYTKESWQKVLQPETCKTVTLVITQATCTNPLESASLYQWNKRALEDTIKLAQAYNTRISIVLPHRVTDPYNGLSQQSVREKLRSFAYQTGGTFLYYDQLNAYSSTALSDTLFQVFTKPTRSLTLVTNSEPSQALVTQPINQPVIVDVSRTPLIADAYRWDFNDDGQWDQETTGPVTEHAFNLVGDTFLRVQALDSSQNVIAETRKLFSTQQTEIIPQPVQAPVTGLVIEQNGEQTTFKWDAIDNAQLLVIDPVSKQLITTMDSSLGAHTITLPDKYDELTVRVLSESGVSEETVVQVSQVAPTVIPVPVIAAPRTTETEEAPEQEREINEEIRCYKLEQCTQSSTEATVEKPVAETARRVIQRQVAIESIEQTETEVNDGTPQVAAAVTTKDKIPYRAASYVHSDKWWQLLLMAGLICVIIGACYSVKRSRTSS